MLSTLRQTIVNICSVLKHTVLFITTIELKFVNLETTMKILLKIFLKTDKELMAYLI